MTMERPPPEKEKGSVAAEPSKATKHNHGSATVCPPTQESKGPPPTIDPKIAHYWPLRRLTEIVEELDAELIDSGAVARFAENYGRGGYSCPYTSEAVISAIHWATAGSDEGRALAEYYAELSDDYYKPEQFNALWAIGQRNYEKPYTASLLNTLRQWQLDYWKHQKVAETPSSAQGNPKSEAPTEATADAVDDALPLIVDAIRTFTRREQAVSHIPTARNYLPECMARDNPEGPAKRILAQAPTKMIDSGQVVPNATLPWKSASRHAVQGLAIGGRAE